MVSQIANPSYDSAILNRYDAQRRLEELTKKYMPSGSGFDSGTQFDIHGGAYKNLRFVTSFHHMNEGGYDGWTEHVVTVMPSLAYGFELKISGRNRNDIKGMMYDTFQAILEQPIPEWEFSSYHKEPANAEASG